MTYTPYQAKLNRTAAKQSRVAAFFRRLINAYIESRMRAVKRELRSRYPHLDL